MKPAIGGPVRGHIQVELLSAYLDQEASPAEQATIDAHLSQCTQCRAELESLRRTVGLLAALPRVPVPRAFTLSEAQVGVQRPSAAPNWFGGLLRGLGAVAAIALVAFVAFTVLRPEQTPWSPGGSIARVAPTTAVSTEPASGSGPAASEAPVQTLATAAPLPTLALETAPATEAGTENAPALAAPAPATEDAAMQNAPTEPAAAMMAPPEQPQAPSPEASTPTEQAADAARSATQNATAPASPAPAAGATNAAPTGESAAAFAAGATDAPLETPTGDPALAAKAAPTGDPGVGAAGMGMGMGGGGPAEAIGIPSQFLTPEPTPPGRALTALPAGLRLAYADLNALWAVDRDGGARQLVAGRGIHLPLLSPDEKWIAYRIYLSEGLQVWAIRWEGGDPKLLLDDTQLPADNLPEGYERRVINDVRWEPQGNVLAVTMALIPDPANPTPPQYELWRVDVETGKLEYSSQLGAAWRPYYSPDGKNYLVLQYGTDENPDGTLTLVNTRNGKGKHVMTFAASPAKPAYDHQIVWTPDSKTAWLALPVADYGTPVPPNGTTLYRMNGGGQIREAGQVDAAQVYWSPDAQRMAYTRYTDETLGKNELYVANADGSTPQLYTTMTQGEFLSWSPSSQMFIYLDNFQIYAGAPGEQPRRLANATSMVGPKWVSDTELLAFHETGSGWLLALRDVNGDAAGLMPLPRDAMWDAGSN